MENKISKAIIANNYPKKVNLIKEDGYDKNVIGLG